MQEITTPTVGQAPRKSVSTEKTTPKEKRASGSAGRLWADLSMMQDLEDKLNTSGTIADSRKSFQRGPESYVLPDQVKFEPDDEQPKASRFAGDVDKDGTRKPNCGSMFGDEKGDELAAVESFGVALPSRKRRRRCGERSTEMATLHYERKFRYNKQHHNKEACEAGDADAMEAESASAPATGPLLHGHRRNTGGRAYEKRARLSYQSSSRNSSKFGSTSTLSSEADGGAKSERDARLRGLLAQDYTADKLFVTEFPPDASIADLGELMAKALGERLPITVKEAVEALGKESALEIFTETKNIEKTGGMMIMNGRRRRTPGGVFLFLVKLFQAEEWRPGEPVPTPKPAEKQKDGTGKAEESKKRVKPTETATGQKAEGAEDAAKS